MEQFPTQQDAPLLSDRNSGCVLESHTQLGNMWCPLDCLGNHGALAAQRAEEQPLAFPLGCGTVSPANLKRGVPSK